MTPSLLVRFLRDLSGLFMMLDLGDVKMLFYVWFFVKSSYIGRTSTKPNINHHNFHGFQWRWDKNEGCYFLGVQKIAVWLYWMPYFLCSISGISVLRHAFYMMAIFHLPFSSFSSLIVVASHCTLEIISKPGTIFALPPALLVWKWHCLRVQSMPPSLIVSGLFFSCSQQFFHTFPQLCDGPVFLFSANFHWDSNG